ncbi:hypothetical protein GRAQ_03210 [Rahnella aquatilis CIP 78.65 = ATCC 33071]|nr:hypothetical protein GRAQ_03210 [Rahnella aquatilis CIP 78.65 = ATCC 33071]
MARFEPSGMILRRLYDLPVFTDSDIHSRALVLFSLAIFLLL